MLCVGLETYLGDDLGYTTMELFSNCCMTPDSRPNALAYLCASDSVGLSQTLCCLQIYLLRRTYLITGWAVAQTCCISQWSKYRKSGIFGYPWEQNP